MKNMQYNSYYRNSSVIVDLAVGQIPRSTGCLVKTATFQNDENQNGDIPKRRQKAWPKRRQTKTAKVKTATRNGCTVRGLQAFISRINCRTYFIVFYTACPEKK